MASLALKSPKLLLSGRYTGITLVLFTEYPKYISFLWKSAMGEWGWSWDLLGGDVRFMEGFELQKGVKPHVNVKRL